MDLCEDIVENCAGEDKDGNQYPCPSDGLFLDCMPFAAAAQNNEALLHEIAGIAALAAFKAVVACLRPRPRPYSAESEGSPPSDARMRFQAAQRGTNGKT